MYFSHTLNTIWHGVDPTGELTIIGQATTLRHTILEFDPLKNQATLGVRLHLMSSHLTVALSLEETQMTLYCNT